LGSEPKRACMDPVVDQLNTESIACQDESTPTHIPYSQTKHAIQAIQHVIAPLLVSMDDHFRVALCPEDMAEAHQLVAELLEVVDLSVKYDPGRVFRIRHG